MSSMDCYRPTIPWYMSNYNGTKDNGNKDEDNNNSNDNVQTQFHIQV